MLHIPYYSVLCTPHGILWAHVWLFQVVEFDDEVYEVNVSFDSMRCTYIFRQYIYTATYLDLVQFVCLIN